MNKFNQLKLQVIASTIVALLIIVFSYWYFLQQQTAYSNHVQQYMQASQKTFALTQRWEADLQQLLQYNAIDHQVALLEKSKPYGEKVLAHYRFIDRPYDPLPSRTAKH